MKKIISLFQRNYESDRMVRDEIVPGAEWVIADEGRATIKYDGTACLVRDGILYKRYDRKLIGSARRRKKRGYEGSWNLSDYRPAPEGWEAAEDEPNEHTGHWPGWLPIGNGPENQWHREAWERCAGKLEDGSYELVGPKINGNPYRLERHEFWRHGAEELDAPRTYRELSRWFLEHEIEGLVWWREPGNLNADMVKIKRRDFGLPWPIN